MALLLVVSALFATFDLGLAQATTFKLSVPSISQACELVVYDFSGVGTNSMSQIIAHHQ